MRTNLYLPKQNITINVGEVVQIKGSQTKEEQVEIIKFGQCGGKLCDDCLTSGIYLVTKNPNTGLSVGCCPDLYKVYRSAVINKVTEVI